MCQVLIVPGHCTVRLQMPAKHQQQTSRASLLLVVAKSLLYTHIVALPLCVTYVNMLHLPHKCLCLPATPLSLWVWARTTSAGGADAQQRQQQQERTEAEAVW